MKTQCVFAQLKAYKPALVLTIILAAFCEWSLPHAVCAAAAAPSGVPNASSKHPEYSLLLEDDYGSLRALKSTDYINPPLEHGTHITLYFVVPAHEGPERQLVYARTIRSDDQALSLYSNCRSESKIVTLLDEAGYSAGEIARKSWLIPFPKDFGGKAVAPAERCPDLDGTKVVQQFMSYHGAGTHARISAANRTKLSAWHAKPTRLTLASRPDSRHVVSTALGHQLKNKDCGSERLLWLLPHRGPKHETQVPITVDAPTNGEKITFWLLYATVCNDKDRGSVNMARKFILHNGAK